MAVTEAIKTNWFCLIKFNLCCELIFLNCLHMYNGCLLLHETHELCVTTYACLIGLLTPLLLLFLGCWLALISSIAWHLPSRNLITASSSVIPWETAFISHCFLVTSSTCSINIWYNNTSCKGMLKSNALITFKLLWNWLINALKSVVDFLLITGSDNNDFTWAAAHCYTYHISHSKFQATWKFCVTRRFCISCCASLVTEDNK